MALDFDSPPTYTNITRDASMEYIWIDWFGSFYQTLVSYLSSTGIFPPQLTEEQKKTIKSPQNGQTIYNTSLDTMQYYKVSSGTWTSF